MLAKYDIANLLGKGTFGEVFMAHPKDNPDESLAVKKICDMSEDGYYDIVGVRETEFYNVIQEYGIPGVVRMKESIIHPEQKEFNTYIVMEACMGGSLDDIMSDDGVYSTISPLERLTRWVQYVATFRDMHSLGISHLDIKTENILCKFPGDISSSVICDGSNVIFSIENLKLNLPSIPFVSPVYRPPEFTSYTDMSSPQKADVWSLGILFLEMFGGEEFITELNDECESFASTVQPELRKYKNLLKGKDGSLHIAKDLYKEKDELNDRIWMIHYVGVLLEKLRTVNLWDRYMSSNPIYQSVDGKTVTLIRNLANFVQKYVLTGGAANRISTEQLYNVLHMNLKGKISYSWHSSPVRKPIHIAKDAHNDIFWGWFFENILEKCREVKFYCGGVKRDVSDEFVYYVKAICDYYLNQSDNYGEDVCILFGACLLLAGEVTCYDIRRKELITLGLLPECNYQNQEYEMKRKIAQVYNVMRGKLPFIASTPC